MAVRYPATVKLAIAHTESVRDFEVELPFMVKLSEIKLMVATKINELSGAMTLATEDIVFLELSVPSVDYLGQGYPRWVGQPQDLMEGKYSMMKHARRSGWRMEAAGGYDHDVRDEQGWLEAKKWSAMKHGEVMSLHVEVPPVVESDEDLEQPFGGLDPGSPSPVPSPRLEVEEPDPMPTAAEMAAPRTKRPLASRIASPYETRFASDGGGGAGAGGDAVGDVNAPFAKSRWGGKNGYLERLQLKAYGSADWRERAEALRELGAMRDKAMEALEVSKKAQLTPEQRAAAQASIQEKERLAKLREEDRLAKVREAAEAVAAKERELAEQQVTFFF